MEGAKALAFRLQLTLEQLGSYSKCNVQSVLRIPSSSASEDATPDHIHCRIYY